MKLLLLFMLLTMPIMVNNENPLEKRARGIAEEYYSSFQQLAQMPDASLYGEEGRLLENKIMKLAGADQTGHDMMSDFRVSNDIDPILGSINSEKSDVTLSNYVGHFIDYAAKYDFGYAFNVVSCNTIEAPSKKGMEIDEFVKIVVCKTYSYVNRFNDVNETMVLAFTDNNSSMSSISNSFGTSQSSGDLFAQALEYYNNRQYKEALEMFEKQIELFGSPIAYYYASIMYYKNQGCRGMGYSARYKKYIDYLKMVANKGSGVYKYRAQFTLVREGIE